MREKIISYCNTLGLDTLGFIKCREFTELKDFFYKRREEGLENEFEEKDIESEDGIIKSSIILSANRGFNSIITLLLISIIFVAIIIILLYINKGEKSLKELFNKAKKGVENDGFTIGNLSFIQTLWETNSGGSGEYLCSSRKNIWLTRAEWSREKYFL